MASSTSSRERSSPSPRKPVRRRVRVEGTVQGVGFRPFVHGLARRFALAGFVGNDPQGVVVEVEGRPRAVEAFLAALTAEAPALASVERVTVADVPAAGDTAFVIVDSVAAGERRVAVPPDTATCDDCLREVFDPSDRRFRYPFTNCTACGPRFTIVRDVPYDRTRTTMAAFPLCVACEREYRDPSDRRYHAEPVCCPACGPALRLLDTAGEEAAGEAIASAGALLRAGAVVAVKGLGGYHLAVLARDEQAVARLRSRKHREDKPFAVQVADAAAALRLVEAAPDEIALLESARRPIVLLRRRSDAAGDAVADAVAPGNRHLGVLLPYTALHHLLAREVHEPLVLTSGNVSDEPIAFADDDARERLAGIADAFLVHDREIATRTDDSVARVLAGAPVVLRRSRGYVPEPLRLATRCARPVLGVGAELKSTVCVGWGDQALVSHHIGDLENYETHRAFLHAVDHLQRLAGVAPQVIAHDLHPEYLSTKHAHDLEGVALVGVQHHHAHVASCLADNGVAGPVVGVAFDGLGYGDDGTLWGGELLVADGGGYERVGHLVPVPLPGGAAAIRSPWRMAASYLGAAGADLAVARRNEAQWDAVVSVARSGVGSPLTSSAGRLFDAVAAIVGVRDAITYEGQAAVELEQLADPAEAGAYPLRVEAADVVLLRGDDLVGVVADDVRRGVPPPIVSARFHRGLAAGVVSAAALVAEARGLSTVALSGGVFQNALLLEAVVAGLRERGLLVLRHRRIPPNDGGISLGQVIVAAARERLG